MYKQTYYVRLKIFYLLLSTVTLNPSLDLSNSQFLLLYNGSDTLQHLRVVRMSNIIG